jgi:NADH:ubiquinone oxidoreductase subunit
MHTTTKIYTYFHGKLVGSDAFGNKYYIEKKPTKNRREKRWVMYKGAAEPSKVPPQWHGWLHHTFDAPPTERHIPQHAW